MWVEIFSALFTVLSALIVGIALYHRENAGRIRFSIFIAAIPVVNFILNISLPHYISVGAFVLATTVLCKLILNENKITSLASAMIIAFFHRVMMLVYFSAVYIFAREFFTCKKTSSTISSLAITADAFCIFPSAKASTAWISIMEVSLDICFTSSISLG